DETSLSVPIIIEERLRAVLTMRFASTAIPEADAIERFVPKLRKTAQEIADEFLRQHQREPVALPIEIAIAVNS
ncbi:MAG: hypothetical protein QF580_03705, partial [Gammaproteobacteria bacterium]|nr:hypothetical protein [Gammaproteobacteria bacterium]